MGNNQPHCTSGQEPGEQVPEIRIITVREAASLLRVSTKTIYKKVSRGEIPHKKIGSKIRFLLPALMEWMKG